MNNNLVKIDIVDDESFLKACDILHDGYCDSATIKCDENNGMWKAVFERDFFEDPKLMKCEPRFLFFYKVSFPMAKSELLLEGIKTYEIEDKSNIQIYSFNECQIKNKTYKFFFNEDMKMTFTFKDNPRGKLTDQKLLDKKGVFYTWRNPLKINANWYRRLRRRLQSLISGFLVLCGDVR